MKDEGLNGQGGESKGAQLVQTPYVSPCEEMDTVTRAIINQLKDCQPLVPVPSQKLPFTWLAEVVTI